MLVREHKTIPGKLEVKISDWGLSRKAIADGAYQAQTSVSHSKTYMSHYEQKLTFSDISMNFCFYLFLIHEHLMDLVAKDRFFSNSANILTDKPVLPGRFLG